MKKLVILSLILMAVNYSFSMVVSQRVNHTTDMPAVASGCSMVRMKVIYNNGGGGFNTFEATSWVTLNAGSYYDFSVTIPDGSTIVSKNIEFKFTLSSNTYTYTVTGATNEVINNYSNCSCPTASSKTLWINESTGKGAAVNYFLTSYVSGSC